MKRKKSIIQLFLYFAELRVQLPWSEVGNFTTPRIRPGGSRLQKSSNRKHQSEHGHLRRIWGGKNWKHQVHFGKRPNHLITWIKNVPSITTVAFLKRTTEGRKGFQKKGRVERPQTSAFYVLLKADVIKKSPISFKVVKRKKEIRNFFQASCETSKLSHFLHCSFVDKKGKLAANSATFVLFLSL